MNAMQASENSRHGVAIWGRLRTEPTAAAMAAPSPITATGAAASSVSRSATSATTMAAPSAQ